MANIDPNVPIEINIEKAKQEIIRSINAIGTDYNLPSAILSMILSDISKEVMINAFSMIIGNYDVLPPEGVNQQPAHQVVKNSKTQIDKDA